ncbi:MAG: hypothetical protein LC792_04270, partial [Actinobacteria bacterium]|nr:hypothetical protein [Actinomycetota bacterium]
MNVAVDCASSFRRVNSYFTAKLYTCPECETVWLVGYHEDFTDKPVEAEWGERPFILRPISSERVEQIRTAAGTRALDLDSFAADDEETQTALLAAAATLDTREVDRQVLTIYRLIRDSGDLTPKLAAYFCRNDRDFLLGAIRLAGQKTIDARKAAVAAVARDDWEEGQAWDTERRRWHTTAELLRQGLRVVVQQGVAAPPTDTQPDDVGLEDDEELPAPLLTLLELDPNDSGSVSPELAADICGNDSNAVLEYIRLAEGQTIAWRALAAES